MLPDEPLRWQRLFGALVAMAGVGLAFVPASVQRVRFDDVVYKPLREKRLQSLAYLAWTRPHPSALLTSFVATAKHVVREKFG